jgi:hypothetical protein
MTSLKRLEEAFHSPDPAKTIRAVVSDLALEGKRKEEIYELLEKLLLELRSQKCHREDQEDPVLDAMDALTGWCSPPSRLLAE